MKRLCFYGLFRSGSHVYSAKKSYFATRQLYHFVRPGWRRIGVTTNTEGLTLSAFRGDTDTSLVVVGVKEGGPNHIKIELPSGASGPATWELFETTRDLDCQKVKTVPVQGGTEESDLPDEAVFTLVGQPRSRTDGLQQLDSSLMKKFNITERVNLEFRADLFNTFNHPNFAAPDSSWVGDGSVGQVFSTSGDQRRPQLGLRLSF